MRLVATVLASFALATSAGALAHAGRQPAPPISGQTLDGKGISLAQFRGRPVLVNVWSSW